MKSFTKLIMLAFVIIWVLLPDPIPGPIDDILLLVMGYAKMTKSKSKSKSILN